MNVMCKFKRENILAIRGGQKHDLIPSIQIFDFYPTGRLPYIPFCFKVKSKVNACYLPFL